MTVKLGDISADSTDKDLDLDPFNAELIRLLAQIEANTRKV